MPTVTTRIEEKDRRRVLTAQRSRDGFGRQHGSTGNSLGNGTQRAATACRDHQCTCSSAGGQQPKMTSRSLCRRGRDA
jgi:hypothetical protein